MPSAIPGLPVGLQTLGHNPAKQQLFSCLGQCTFSHCFSSCLIWNMAGELFYILLLRQDRTESRSHCWRPIWWRWLLWRDEALQCLSGCWVILCAAGEHGALMTQSQECQTRVWELEGRLVRGWIRAGRNRSREAICTYPCCSWWWMGSITATLLLKGEGTDQLSNAMIPGLGDQQQQGEGRTALPAPVLMPPGSLSRMWLSWKPPKKGPGAGPPGAACAEDGHQRGAVARLLWLHKAGWRKGTTASLWQG